MCKWGTTKTVFVKAKGGLRIGDTEFKPKGVDSCIAEIVETLTKAKIYTITSCCGHGKRNGEIILEDGRKLIIIAPQLYDDNHQLITNKKRG